MAALFCLTGVVVGIGFLIMCFGMFVNDSYATVLAGVIVMDVGVIGWMFPACYVIVASLRKAFSSDGGATDRPSLWLQ